MAVRIQVDVDAVRRTLDAVGRSASGAIAQGITRTAQQMAEGSGAHARKKIDRPTDSTLRAFRYKRADKADMTAQVFVAEYADKYLRFLEFGGRRVPAAPRRSLPLSEEKDGFGNMPKEVRQLMRRQVRAASSTTLARKAKAAEERAAKRAARENARIEARVDRRVMALLSRNARRRRPGALNAETLRNEIRGRLRAAADQRAARLASRRAAKAAERKKAKPAGEKSAYFVGRLRNHGKQDTGALWKRTKTGLRLIVAFDQRANYRPTLGMTEHWKGEAQRLGPLMIQRVMSELIQKAADAGPAQATGPQRVRTR